MTDEETKRGTGKSACKEPKESVAQKEEPSATESWLELSISVYIERNKCYKQ